VLNNVHKKKKKPLSVSMITNLVLPEQTGTELFRLTAAQDRARTRQAAGQHGLSLQFARTDPRKYSFAVRTVENWNKLPEDVKTSRNGEEFKNKMKKLQRNHRRGDPVKVTDNEKK
jgi:hypothetical protein